MLRWHRLSAFWKSWIFSQEPAEEQSQISEPLGLDSEPQEKEEDAFKSHSSDLQNVTQLNTQNLDYTNLDSVPKTQKSELLKRSCSEPCPRVSEEQPPSCPYTADGCGCKSRESFCSEKGVDCVLQVDNGSEGDDGFLQREGTQRRSRRRFRRVNPRGERELITDGQEPTSYSTVGSAESFRDTLVTLVTKHAQLLRS